jgi:hypothetical protein
MPKYKFSWVTKSRKTLHSEVKFLPSYDAALAKARDLYDFNVNPAVLYIGVSQVRSTARRAWRKRRKK